jgi:hypothetical protein
MKWGLMTLGAIIAAGLTLAACGGTAHKTTRQVQAPEATDVNGYGCPKSQLDRGNRCPANPAFGKTRAQLRAEERAAARAHDGPASSEATACDLPVSGDRAACRNSYSECALSARAKVRSYYSGVGPNLDTIAVSYAKDTYGSSGFAWQSTTGPLGPWRYKIGVPAGW